jgi:hypothetical protein
MARSRIKRGMGPLLKEMRANPIAALINGMVGIVAMGGAVLAGIFRLMSSVDPTRGTGQAAAQGRAMLRIAIVLIALLVGTGFLLFGMLQITTRIRVFPKGMVWYRYGKKHVILWVEVDHFGPDEAAATTLTRWSMVLRNGARIDFHSTLYRRSDFADTMELIAEQIEEAAKEYR